MTLTLSMLLVAGATAQTPLTTELAASGLVRPIFVTHAPSDFERIFIIEKRGRIRIVKNGALLPTPFLDIDARVGGGTSNFSEQGLLGLAFHPNYQSNGLFYVDYTRNNGDVVVFQYAVSADPDVADATSGVRVILIGEPQANHNGGWIGFGPNDGFLYVSTGDGGGAGDQDAGHTTGVGNGQDIFGNLLGKILRLDIDNDDFPGIPATNYAIPADNPFPNLDPNDPRFGGDPEIWAFGLRNPWRPSFDRATGDLYIADVGQASWEEIDFQPAAGSGGENYGWRCREGAHNFNMTGDCSLTPFVEPIKEYNHAAGRCSITGGYVYRGCAIPDLSGAYFYADFCAATIWSLRHNGVSVTELINRTTELTPAGGPTIASITSFGEDAYGELYICDQTGGEVFKIVADNAAGFAGPDCDNNGFADACEILDGSAADVNHDGIPDVCQCIGDADGDGDTDVGDLAALLGNFGLPSGATPADGDADGDGDVDLTDLAIVLVYFGCNVNP